MNQAIPSYFLVGLFFLLVLLGKVVESRETYCERWQGKWDRKYNAVRCLKGESSSAESITVSHNIDNSQCHSEGRPCVIKYSVGVWTGECGSGNQISHNRLFTNQYLKMRGSKTYPIESTGSNICREIYIFNCSRDNRPYDCYYALRVIASSS